MSPSYFYSRCLPQPQGLSPGAAVEKCCAPATRLGLETGRWKTLPEEVTQLQLTCLCLRLSSAIINLTMVPRDIHAKNMEWIAWPHVVPVEELVARILPHQTLAKTMNKHQYPSWICDKTGRLALLIRLLVRICVNNKLSFRSFYVLIYCLKARVSIVRKTMVRNHRRVASSPSAKFKYLRKPQVLQTLSLWGRVL